MSSSLPQFATNNKEKLVIDIFVIDNNFFYEITPGSSCYIHRQVVTVAFSKNLKTTYPDLRVSCYNIFNFLIT